MTRDISLFCYHLSGPKYIEKKKGDGKSTTDKKDGEAHKVVIALKECFRQNLEAKDIFPKIYQAFRILTVKKEAKNKTLEKAK